MPGKYLTTTQAAKICGVTRFTIANWEKTRKLKSSKTAGGHRRILKKDLMNFIKKNHISKFNQSDFNDSIALKSSPDKRERKERKGDRRKTLSCEHAADTYYQIPHCWEFRFQDSSQHNCADCLVFKEGARKCFLVTKMLGLEKKQCKYECLNCEYFLRYYPMKQNASISVNGRQISCSGNHTDKKEKDASGFFRNGLYASGKCIASIRNVLAKKSKNNDYVFGEIS